jgi:hypothetical protein
MSNIQTENQKQVLGAVRRLQADRGRSVLIREIAAALARPIASVYPSIQTLVEEGTLVRGFAGRGKGVRIADTDRRYREGWQDALNHIEPIINVHLLELHASEALTDVILHAIHDAKGAANAS